MAGPDATKSLMQFMALLFFFLLSVCMYVGVFVYVCVCVLFSVRVVWPEVCDQLLLCGVHLLASGGSEFRCECVAIGSSPTRVIAYSGRVKLAGNIPLSVVPSFNPISQPSS